MSDLNEPKKVFSVEDHNRAIRKNDEEFLRDYQPGGGWEFECMWMVANSTTDEDREYWQDQLDNELCRRGR